jgi:DNA (cytosine-5)-methyltransferase 1
VFGPPTHSGDVSKFEEVAETLGQIISGPFEGLFVGGPPCQPFSIAANQRFSKSGENFKRVGFLHEKNGIQTFPKDYIFMGASARQFTQVGNAVPPILAAQIGNSLAESYF